MTETKRFPLRVVLSASTGRLLTEPKGPHDNGIGDLYEILNWMTNDNLMTHQLPRAAGECQPWLLRWFPELRGANECLGDLGKMLEQGDPRIAIEMWLETMAIGGMKREYEVPQIPRDDHDVIDPYDELVQMRGSDEGIILVKAGHE